MSVGSSTEATKEGDDYDDGNDVEQMLDGMLMS